MIRLRNLVFIAGILLFGVSNVALAQDPQASPTDSEAAATAQKEKEALETKANALLEQVVGQVQLLKLPENRISVQIAAADMLWARNEARARSMFSLAAEGIAEMMRGSEGNPQRSVGRLRQQLVLTAAQHDATLAYQLLATTQPVTTPSDAVNNFGMRSADGNLEQSLLARIAVTDPKFAAQKAEEALASGQYPTSLAQVISNLQSKDKEASAKLTAKVVNKLQSENLLANPQAGNLALYLLRSGPLPSQTSASATSNGPGNDFGTIPILGETAFQGVMNTVIDAALRATRSQATSQVEQGNGRGRRNFGGVQNAVPATPTDAQLEQQNARRMLGGLQMLMPQIEQFLPARAAAVRNKMTELGMGSDPRLAFNQVSTLMQQGTADSLVTAASAAPPQMQPRLYQQAAQKALQEGNIDQARQIANDHLQATARDRVLQQVDFQVLATKAEAGNVDQLSQILGGLRSDDERIDMLLQLAAQTQKPSGESPSAAEGNSKAALKFLSEAKRLANRRATNYSQLEQQLRVADAFAALDAAKSFEVLDPGITQLNELLSAAALLNGFEINIFREGELPLEGGNGLSEMVLRYGQELARLAKIDFARAESSANKFSLAESRLLSQLAIVRNVLGVPQVTPVGGGLGGRRMFGRRGQ